MPSSRMGMLCRGIFAVCKPKGITSAAVTGQLKRILLQSQLSWDTENSDTTSRAHDSHMPHTDSLSVGLGRQKLNKKLKLGHGGTLDSFAEGVLVIAIGEDCKKLSAFLAGDKCYEAIGELGRATETYCPEGAVVAEQPFNHVTRKDLEGVLESFTGEISQTPPIYSALKFKGQRFSDLARAGVVVTPQPRRVTVYSLKLLNFEPPQFRISVCCSSGTYIRSLVHDIGLKLSTVAHLANLSRTKQGPFTLDTALAQDKWTLENIKRAIDMFAPLVVRQS